MPISRLLLSIAACLVAAPLAAQPPESRTGFFVDAFISPDWDDAANRTTSVPGATSRWGLAFGHDAGKSGFEFGVGVPQWHSQVRTYLYGYGGASYGYLQQFHDYKQLQTVRRRSVDVTALYRANLPVNRFFTFTWVVGLGFVSRPEQVIDVTNEVLPDGQLKEVDNRVKTSSAGSAAGIGGLDAEFRLARHVSLVPRARATVFPSLLDDSGSAPHLLTVRPEIAVRWRF
jgi:hypothetical protein